LKGTNTEGSLGYLAAHRQYGKNLFSTAIKPIKSARDHERALQEIERLWGARRGTPEGDRLDVWIALVESYERTHYPIDLRDPLEAIRFRLEQQGAGYRDLVGVIGTRTRVYEVMPGDRPLSLQMIRRLHDVGNGDVNAAVSETQGQEPARQRSDNSPRNMLMMLKYLF